MKACAERTQVYALHIVVSFIDRFTRYIPTENQLLHKFGTRGK